ncbi:MAG: hypothetical protein A2V85_07470 [Chloroflexi bacterium RBG_16_72_14]|nr:MAG: hypothetical protein A2V85_07470 [Chloroflexi bacterium RBG_16_72_14]
MAQRIDTDAAARSAIHKRWIEKTPRSEWHEDQCLFCRFYLPIEGPMGSDWGACANPVAPRDAQVTFEHDHCDAFEFNEGY